MSAAAVAVSSESFDGFDEGGRQGGGSFHLDCSGSMWDRRRRFETTDVVDVSSTNHRFPLFPFSRVLTVS